MKACYDCMGRNGCICHILHSAISGGIVDNEPAKAVIQKIHQVAGAHNRSYAFRYALQEEQRKLKIKERILIQDVITRWGSVDIACASFLDHPDDKNPEDDSFFQFQAVNNALRRMKWPKDKIQSLVFTKSEMIRVKLIHNFLNKFDVYSTTLGGSKYVTSSLVLPMILSIQSHLKETPDDPSFIKDMKDEIFLQLNRRIKENESLVVLKKCTSLDPRFKRLKVIKDKQEREDIFDSLEDELRSLITLKQATVDSGSCDEADIDDPEPKKRKLGLDFSESEDEDEDCRTPQPDTLKVEFKAYR